ncbi:MAG: carboxypeptidase-like regulatory domain-containing protein [Bacteroidetes bacterium]|nr:carboxypeptidase-like regulatory domain-containing protein [Bacteroidota bacterium]
MRQMLRVMFLVALISMGEMEVSAQCVVRGRITDKNGEVPIGVAIFSKSDASLGTTTDIDGNFELKVSKPDRQVLRISYVGYKTIEDTIQCSGGGVLTRNYVIEPTTQDLKTVVVTANAVKSLDVHMETVKKLSSKTFDYISSETIKKTVDANVAAAITRVTGVSSTSNGFITVRGIGDRYLKTTINGCRIPTLDPLTNNIKLDIFPASLVDNIIINKTASPDLPGDWAGAYVSIETKEFPEALSVYMETSLGYNSKATFKEVLSSERSSTDWLGFDNSFRDRSHSDYIQFNNNPSTYDEFVALGLGDYYRNLGVTKNTPWTDTYFKLGLIELGLLGKAQFDDQAAFDDAKTAYNSLYYREHAYDLLNADAVNSEKTFPNTWRNTVRKAPMNFSQSFSIGNQVKFLKKTLGYMIGFRYSSATQFDPDSYGNRFGVQSKIIDGKAADFDKIFQQASKEIHGWSALFGVSYKLDQNNTVSLLFMPNITGINNVRDMETIPTIGSDSDPYSHRIYQFYESRKQMITQFKTDHYLPRSRVRIEFNSSYTKGKSNLPDLRVTPYINPDSSVQNAPEYIIGTGINTGRYFRYLDENIFDSQLSGELPLGNDPALVRKIKIGASYQYNFRQQDNYFYQLLEGNGSEIIRASNPLADAFGLDRFNIITIPNHSYSGNHGDSLRSVQQYYQRFVYPNNRIFGNSHTLAGFVMLDYSIVPRIRISGGLRVEQASMFTDCNLFDDLHLASDDNRRRFIAPSPILNIMIRPGKLDEVSYLPSISFIIKLKDQEDSPINFRLNYSSTVARPSLRELSDNAYFDYEINKVIYGNSLLKMVHINNYDLRLESYFKSGDNVSLSLFYKEFRNHIEVADFGQYLVWINNPNISWAKGVEIEGKKSIGTWLEFRANLTLVDSRSAFNTSYTKPEGYLVQGRDVSRTMLDQAPYVINAMITYFARKAGVTASISYNLQGPRVITTGSYKDIPDVYEMPRNLVDLKILKNFGKHYSLSLKVMDLLNTSITRAYKIGNNYDFVYDNYKYGTSYILAFSYKL